MTRSWRRHPLFGIREKLSLSFAALLVIVIVLGVYSIRQFMMLSTSIDIILQDSFSSVLATKDMQEGIQRMDNGMLRAMLGHEAEGAELVDSGRRLFIDGVNSIRTSPSHVPVADRMDSIELNFPVYSDAAEYVLRLVREEGAAEEYFVSAAQPVSLQLQNAISGVQDLHLARIVQAHSDAGKRIRDAQTQTSVALTSALILSLAAIYYFGREILLPILQLTHAADAVRRGELDVEVPVQSPDELGELSATFNSMTAELRDLAQSQKAQLLRLNRATQKVLDNVADAIALVMPDGRVETCSHVAHSVFGLGRGKRVRESEYPWISDLFERALRTDETVTLPADEETIQAFVGGDERFFYPSAAAIEDDNGHVTGVLFIIRDITDMQLHEEMKRDAVATVSHQLKTPLTAIRMALHMLRDARFGDLNERQADLAQTAQDESDRLFRMVQGLLDMSRIKSGRVMLECVAVPPMTILSAAADVYRGQADAKGVALNIEADAGLPEVWVDSGRLEHVFMNLVGNGVKYTPPGGTVYLRASADTDWVQFSVLDSGPGIPEGSLARIFDPFYRAPEQEDASGAGLGLAIARQIAEAHGGRIEASNGNDGGACFSVWLPRADAVSRLGLNTHCEDENPDE